MRKDYQIIEDTSFEINEIDAVEKQWTNIWDKGGWKQRRVKYFKYKEEYRVMLPFLKKLRPGANGLDGGCGLGEWILFLSKLIYQPALLL